jgi:hypothetical protein
MLFRCKRIGWLGDSPFAKFIYTDKSFQAGIYQYACKKERAHFLERALSLGWTKRYQMCCYAVAVCVIVYVSQLSRLQMIHPELSLSSFRVDVYVVVLEVLLVFSFMAVN